MNTSLQQVYLVRHGETEWSLSRQHTGKTDLPLTEKGEAESLKIGRRLEEITFAAVFSSPRQRAKRTAELAGFGSQAIIEPDLAEWDYGDYEGRTTAEIRQKVPDWDIFRDGCPNGDSPEQVGQRADKVIGYIRRIEGNVLIFSHSHFLRAFAARWISLPANQGRCFLLNTSSISILTFEHTINDPVIGLWNDLNHINF